MRGKYTQYIRNSGFPNWIEEIQVSDDNSNWTTIKNIDYYSVSNSDPNALHGLVKQESVPDVGGSGEDMVAKYFYDETVNGLTVYRKSPTRVEYQWFNPATQQYEWVTSTTGYGHAGRALWTEDALGNRIDLTYDVMGRPKKRFEPSNDDERGQVSSVSYNSGTGCSTLTDNSKSWRTGQLVGTSLRIDTAAAAGGKDYVVLSNTSTSITVQGNLVYDGVQTNDSYKVTPFTETQYGTSGSSCSSCVGQVVWEKDLRGYKTYYSYNPAGRVVEVRNDVTGDTSSNPLVKYVYDGFGRTKEVWTYTGPTCPGRKTSYEYDQLGRITKITYPTDSQGGMLLWNEYYRYDVMGNLVASIIGVVDGSGNITAGEVTAYAYDDLYRLVKVKYDYNTSIWPSFNISISDQDADVRYTYDGSSSLKTAMIEKHGTETLVSEYEYDGQGRLVTYTPPLPADYTVNYAYNDLDEKTSVTIKDNDQDKYRTTYAYFKNGYLKEVKGQQWSIQSSQWDDMVLVEYEYDKNGGCTKRINNGGSDITTNYTYSDRGELTNISHDKSGTLYALSYFRDLGGNPISIDYSGSSCPSVVSGKAVEYTYDAISRLLSEQIGVGTPTSWVYDWVGNRSQTGTYSYNQVDQLISGQAYQYDMRGNLSLDPQGKVFSYGSTNLLAGVVDGVNTVDMTWDADNQRVRLEAESNTWQFIYDSTAGIPAVLVAKTDNDETYIVRGPNGDLLADITDGIVNYYHFNDLGSTMLVTNGSGAVTDGLAYSAWGDILAGTTKPYNYVGSLGYYSHNTGQVIGDILQLGVRFYDAETGRFTQRDPIQDGLNWYEYVEGNPQMYVDPTGLSTAYLPGFPLKPQPILSERDKEALKCAQNWRDYWIKNYPWDKEHNPPRFGDPGHDKVGHCFVTCKMIKDCGMSRDEALFYGKCKEILDFFGKTGSDADDMDANRAGADIAANPNSNCLPDCAKRFATRNQPK